MAGMIVTREQVVREALEWEGTRFAIQQRRKGQGADCAGLVVGVGHLVGALDIDPEAPEIVAKFGAYTQQPNPARMFEALDMMMVRVRVENAGPGDVVYMRFNTQSVRAVPQHLGIITRDGWKIGGRFIHALAHPSRRVVEQGIDEAWWKRGVRAFRYPAVQRAVERGED